MLIIEPRAAGFEASLLPLYLAWFAQSAKLNLYLQRPLRGNCLRTHLLEKEREGEYRDTQRDSNPQPLH